MNQEDQRYLDSLTKEELIQERAILKARILTLAYSPQQRKRESQELIEKAQYIQRRLLHLTSGDLLKSLSPPIKRPKQIKP